MAKKVSKKSKRRLILFGIPSVIVIIYFAVTFITYTSNYNALLKEEKALKTKLSSLLEEKKNLKGEIQKLNDPNYIVRYAKEYYLYSKDGEYVIKLDGNKEEVIKEEDDDKTIYVVLIVLAILLSIIFLKKKNTSD